MFDMRKSSVAQAAPFVSGGRSAQIAPLPGPALITEIANGIDGGRPGIWLSRLDDGDRLGVPKAMVGAIERGKFVPVAHPPLHAVLRPRVAYGLLSGHFDELTFHDWTQAARLYVAALRDIGAVSWEDLPSTAGFGDAGSARETTEEKVREGRRLWARLGAWPWTSFSDGRPPRDWWRDGASRDVAFSFNFWRGSV